MLKRQEKMKRRLGVCRCGLPQQLLKAHAMLGYVAVDCPGNQTRRCGLEEAGDYQQIEGKASQASATSKCLRHLGSSCRENGTSVSSCRGTAYAVAGCAEERTS